MNVRIKLIILLLILTCLLIPSGLALASDISNAQYTGQIQVTNAGTDTTAVSAPLTLSTQNMIDANMIDAGATDAAMRTAAGVDTAFMPGYGANPWVFFVDELNQNEQRYNYLYSGGAVDGKIRYFPGAAGMTTNDAAALELGNNFEVEVSGLPVEGNQRTKDGAFVIGVQSDQVAAGIVTGSEQTYGSRLAPSHVANFGDTIHRFGLRLDGPVMISKYEVSLYKTGSPIGTLYVRVRDTLTDDIIGTLGTLNVSTLSTSDSYKVFDSNPVYVLTDRNVRISVEYTDGDASNYVHFGRAGSGTVDRFTYSSGGDYTDESGTPYGEVYYYNLLTVVGDYTQADQVIKVTADGAGFNLYIDGNLEDTVALGGVSVPDNANNWVDFANGSMPYVDYIKTTVNGTLQQHIAWQYAATLTDQSGVGNNPSSVSFRTTASDADVSAELLSFTAANPSSGPTTSITSETWLLMEDVPGAPTGLFSEGSMNFLFAGAIEDFADSTGLPLAMLVFIYAFGAALILGFIAFRLSMGKRKDNTVAFNRGSILIQALVSLLVMVYFTLAGGGVIPAWVLIPFALEAFAALMIKQTPYPW